MYLLSLDDLRPQLGIPEINTGRQFAIPSPSGFITDDLEELHAETDEYGRLRLFSGTEFPPYLYRGQPEEHSPCLPTLARLEFIENRLLALCCNSAFEDAISEHPMVRLSEQIRFLNCPLHIDKQGIAQHYGLATDILDLTSNFDVASFFATCRWVDDNTNQSYQPIFSTNKPGVIYRLNYPLYKCSGMPAELETIGWQPLKRPEQQRACVLRMKPGQDFCALPAVQIIKFRQIPEVSTRIWKAFDEGNLLFPYDAAAELANRAKTLTQFTRQQVDKAWEKLDEWDGITGDTDKRQAVEKNACLSITATRILSWDGLDVEHDKVKLADQLREVISKVRYRLAAYPTSQNN